MPFEHMFRPRFRAMGLIGEQRGIDPELARDEGEHRRGRRLRWSQGSTGVAEDTELDGKPKAVAGAALRSDQCEIVCPKHEVLGHLGLIDRDSEQAVAL